MMKNWQKLLYHCSRIESTNIEIPTFKAPVAYRINYQPVKGYTNVLQYGEKIDRTYRAIIPLNVYAGVFKEGDLLYLCGKMNEDGNPPPIDEKYVNGVGANAKVISVKNQNLMINMVIERL